MEVDKTDCIAPAAVTGAKADAGDGKVLLTWTASADEDYFGTRITFEPEADGVAQPVTVQGKAGAAATYTVAGLANGTAYAFTVQSVDTSGNRSAGATITATSEQVALGIALAVPSDPQGGTPALSNTSAEVKVSITICAITDGAEAVTATVEKAVWRAGAQNEGVRVADLLASADAEHTLAVDDDGNAAFTVTESGWYDVVARDSAGHTAWEQVQVRTIDRTAPANVSRVRFGFDIADDVAKPIVLTWLEPTARGTYDSPLAKVAVSYVINDEGEKIDAGTVDAGKGEVRLAVPRNTGAGRCYINELANGTAYTFTVRSVDTSGNRSAGATITATPEQVALGIALAVPSDPQGGTPALSNTSAEVRVAITICAITDGAEAATATATVEKAVWRAGAQNEGVRVADLLASADAEHTLTVDGDGNAAFTVTESGWYDVVARDSAGHTAWEQVQVRTIDRTAPAEVQFPFADFNSIEHSEDPIVISWYDPVPESVYDSPLDHIIVTYTVNDDTTVVPIGTVPAGVQEVHIPVPTEVKGYLLVTLQTVDAFGNTSRGKTVQAWCFSSMISVTDSDVASKIATLNDNTKIVLTGEISATTISNIKSALTSKDANILVSLDMSAATGITELPDKAFTSVKNIISVALPVAMTKIGYQAFSDCTSLEYISIPETVTSIRYRAFNGCENLKSIIIPEAVATIDSTVFYNCSKLESIVILGNIPELAYYIFFGCTYLTEVTLPASITKITGDNCFRGCVSLESLTFNGTMEQWNAIEKVETWQGGSCITRIVCTDGVITL